MTTIEIDRFACAGFTVKGKYCGKGKVHNASFCSGHLKQVRSYDANCSYTEGRTATGGVVKACTQPAANDGYPFRCKAHLS